MSSKAKPKKVSKLTSNQNSENDSVGRFLLNSSHSEQNNFRWWVVFGLLLCLSTSSRLYKADVPDHVCWDETHFGKMASWYINRTFFFDVHPPLGKMLIGLSGKLSGYDGRFGFVKPGDKYGDTNYVGMRVFCALLGSALVPFCFIIVWEMTQSLSAASMAAILILLDVGILTLSRYILLDPILLFFIAGAVMSMTRFDSYHERPFSKWWWTWLILTGAFLSCAISVKFVGLFVVILVGIRTIVDLWNILGDLSKPFVFVIKHFVARVICLIIIPALLYMTFFYIHLRTLNKSGTGDGFFSSAFQSQLEGNSLYQASMPRDVAYGAIITLKNHRTGGGYLHSHWHLYPEGVGARQQQVTAYSHKDDNNRFVVNRYDRVIKPEEDVQLLKNGDFIRLEHFPTTRNLHSHKEYAPITKRHQQITCYGENGTGDANDVWRVEVVGGKEGEVVHTVTSKLRFLHYLTGCALHSHSKQLPKWGFEQMEVSCNPNVRDKNNLWNVEDNYFPRLPNVSFEVYAPSFIERFFESHAVMFQGNAGLKPKEGEVTSKPWQWPINFRGQFFSANDFRIYLLGNPFIWWGNIGFMLLFFVMCTYILVRWQRGVIEPSEVKEKKERLCRAGAWLLLGWAIHYVPFYAMGRVLYFHHYFPALLFSTMLTAVVLDYIIESLPLFMPPLLAKSAYHWSVGIFYSLVLYSFYLFYPLSYGMDATSSSANSTMKGLRWLDSWEF